VLGSVQGPLLGQGPEGSRLGALTEKAGGSSRRGEYAGGGVSVWKWRDKHRARIIQLLIKVYFRY